MKQIQQTTLDKFIGYFSPQRANQRIVARIRNQILQNHFVRKYEGASQGRRTEKWLTQNFDANSEIINADGLLRSRSRDLIRNNPWAARAIKVIESNVIGRGIMVEFDAGRKRQAQVINEAWKSWSETTYCDLTGLNDFNGLQKLVMRCVVESGDVLVRLHFNGGGAGQVPLQLEILEPDFLDKTKLSAANGDIIYSGIEIDDQGRKIAYHLYKQHPGGRNFFGMTGFESMRVDARYVLHIYDTDRAGQLRGVPWFSNSIIKMRDLDEYEDAQLVKQKISACLTGFILDPEGATGLDDAEVEIAEKFEPGTINILGPGQDYKQSEPPRVDGYKDYTAAVLHAIAAGLGISYESLTGDLSQTNFSSAKLGRQEMDRNITAWREQMIYPKFLTPVITNWLLAASLISIPVDGVDWKYTAPRREMIQPDKEIPSTIEAIRAGLISLREGIRQIGYDPDKVFEEIQKTNADLDKLGLVLTSDPRKNLAPTIVAQTTNADQNADQENQ